MEGIPMADDNEQVSQDEIEQLIEQSQDGDRSPAGSTPSSAAAAGPAESEALLSSPASPAAPRGDDSAVTQNDIELLMNKAEQALASIDEGAGQPTGTLPAGIKSFEFKQFGGTPANTDSATLELMRDVQLDMTIELGRTHMQLEDVLKLRQGAVVPLDKLAGEPADIYVNGRLVARGEVLVLNDNFCVRVAELIMSDSA